MLSIKYYVTPNKEDSMMNKITIRFLLALLAMIVNVGVQAMCSTACNISAHTTFVPRLMSQNSVLELALHNYYHYHLPCCDSECPPWISLEVTAPYYFKSTKNKRLASYFLPDCKNCLTVAENNTADVSSPWLQLITPIATPYQSTICIDPKRTVIGGAFKLFMDLSYWFDGNCWYNNWWASIFVPVQQVRHDLHITETASAVPGVFDGITNEIEAFNNPAWNYGKWSVHRLKKTGVDDVNIKVGLDFDKDQWGHAGFYGQIFAPTGNKNRARYLFEPIVGGRQVGVGAGFNGDYVAYECGPNSFDMMLDVRYAYFFKAKEIRSIDLFNGDLSRYLLVVLPNTAAVTTNQVNPLPGINFFTKEVQVKPRSFFEVWLALSFNHCNFHAEIGYDFWYRSKEKICLPDQDLGVGIFDIAAGLPPCNMSASCARICQAVRGQAGAPASDATFVSVKNSKASNKIGTQRDGSNCCPTYCSTQCSYLNLDSAASPKALSSTVYGAVSYDCCLCCEYPVMIGVGGQYEFAHRRSALNQYGVWLKTAISF